MRREDSLVKLVRQGEGTAPQSFLELFMLVASFRELALPVVQIYYVSQSKKCIYVAFRTA